MTKISATILFLRGIGPLTLPIDRPWMIRWIKFSNADFGSGRRAAWRHWNEPCARSDQNCQLICVEPLSAWESGVKLMIQSHGLQIEHLKSFFIHFVGWKKRNKVGHKRAQKGTKGTKGTKVTKMWHTLFTLRILSKYIFLLIVKVDMRSNHVHIIFLCFL